jgi:CRISPR-associated Cas5-like protein
LGLGTLFVGAQANVQLIPQVSLLSLQFRLSEIGSWRRPANIGYGLSYAFPVLVALLTAQEGQLVVIDSPEAHLHPSAQSRMGRLLAHFAAAGVQILVETHSDHLLNGVRLAVKNRTLPHVDVRIHFFTGATSEGHGVLSPAIDPDGRIDEWPDGFLDQSEKDLSQLTGWA